MLAQWTKDRKHFVSDCNLSCFKMFSSIYWLTGEKAVSGPSFQTYEIKFMLSVRFA